MIILHHIDDFFFELFPQLKQASKDEIIAAIESYYSFGLEKPKVEMKEDWLSIDIDINSMLAQESEYKKAIAFCEKGRFGEAKPILKKLIDKSPANSEYHRIMGQITSEEGDQNEAINYLIDALKWDPKNGYALVMMGNIFAKHKNDIETARKYYDQAILVNPNDNIAINNIATNLLQQGSLEEAKKYFWEAVKIDDTYPNTHYALGMIAESEGDLDSALYSTVRALKHCKQRNELYHHCRKQVLDIAKSAVRKPIGKRILRDYKAQLEDKGGGILVDIIEDATIPTAAKFEFAENYDRNNHTLRYQPNYPAIEHLIMHELVHLDLVQQAREKELNQLFVSTQNQKSDFIKTLASDVKRLSTLGIPESSISKYVSEIYDGLNRQIFNAPIDLFIEDFLYSEFAELRPYQFLSLKTLVEEGIKAVTDKKVVELSPKGVLSKSKVYNMVGAMQFNELFGFDYISDYKASAIELKQAEKFYKEFKEYKDNREPAEEYELVLHWAEDLGLEKNFELVNEIEFRTKRTNPLNLLDAIEKDPFDMESKDPYKEREMDKFQKSQAAMGTNMAVVMFMVDAMKYFKDMDNGKVRQIAFDIAMQGTQGFRPDKKDYRIHSMPEKVFSGYHILAYYYVSWAIAIPEMLADLKLPYDAEYQLALTLNT